MGRSRAGPTPRADDPPPSRTRLLDAADALMWERGYEAVGVAELCLAAGVPRGSFYHWFPSKQALAVAMLERSWERVRATVFEPAFHGPGPLTARIARYADTLERTLRRQQQERGCVAGCRFGNFAAELATREPTVRAAVDATFDAMCAMFGAAIEEARAAGEVPAELDVATAAEALCAHMEGLMILAKARRDPTALRRLAPAAERLLGITPAPPTGTGRRATERKAPGREHP